MSSTSETKQPMWNKYWVAYEIRCIETDRRLFQNMAIYVNKQIKSETDLEFVQNIIATRFNTQAVENRILADFKVTLTSWPHFIAKEALPIAQPEEPKTKKPVMKLVVNNTSVESLSEIIPHNVH